MKSVIILLTFFLLTGCSLFTTSPIIVSTVPVESVPLMLPAIDLYSSRNVEWTIVTPENYQQTISNLKHKSSTSLFTLSTENYENLITNTSDIFKMVQQLQSIINAYELYYNSNDSLIADIEIPDIE